ncbi:SGNH/GDSL hydrolase family protein [Secundilactobacillus kimchicus]|uniref:SGNH/GDSL hydrolase family protein n=1 Tax=Secundilactobacillus kimchicus TaxID=528209 RepID=UPI0024A95C84|nr:acyltransferase [Secundilactobacillus kimchicus]
MGEHTKQKPPLMRRPSFWIGAIILVVLIGAATVGRGTISGRLTPHTTKTVKPKPKSKPKPVKLTPYEKKVAAKYQIPAQATALAHVAPVTAIGDSVMVDIIPELKQVFPRVHVNGQVGRQFYELPGIARTLKAQGSLAQNVVVNLGTNGPPEKADVAKFLKVVGPKRQVYWINTHVPTQKWEHQTNTLIDRTAKDNDNVHVVDWHTLSKGHTKWFAPDHIHLEEAGANAYVGLLAKTMAED